MATTSTTSEIYTEMATKEMTLKSKVVKQICIHGDRGSLRNEGLKPITDLARENLLVIPIGQTFTLSHAFLAQDLYEYDAQFFGMLYRLRRCKLVCVSEALAVTLTQ